MGQDISHLILYMPQSALIFLSGFFSLGTILSCLCVFFHLGKRPFSTILLLLSLSYPVFLSLHNNNEPTLLTCLNPSLPLQLVGLNTLAASLYDYFTITGKKIRKYFRLSLSSNRQTELQQYHSTIPSSTISIPQLLCLTVT